MDKVIGSIAWRSKFKKAFNVDIKPQYIHAIFKQYGLQSYPLKQDKNGKEIKGYRESEVNDILMRGNGLKRALIASGTPIIDNKPKKKVKGASQKEVENEIGTYSNSDNDYFPQLSYRDNENDMEKYSDHLIHQYQFEEYKPKKIIVTEVQFKTLIENIEDEGFQIRNGEFNFNPSHQKMSDTRIFDDNGDLRVRKILLPKSQVMSYNLYELFNLNVSKGLKHHKDNSGNTITWGNSINSFITRSTLYMKRIIGNNQVDYITYPQSSSQFNVLMVNKLKEYFPQSEGIKLIPEMLTKNVRGIYVNTQLAKEIGLSNQEIYDLQRRVDYWKKDEDIRDLRRKIKDLTDEITQTIATRGKGRPSNEFRMKQRQVDLYNDEIASLRKGKRGRDSTLDKESGNVKDWQIKSLDDKHRRVLEGIFQINPKYLELRTQLQGKSIVLFDDNISSGATLDDLCLVLKMYGVANIIPITLGVIHPTIYKQGDRKREN